MITTDSGPGQIVKFTTTVEVTGDESTPIPEDAFRRLVSYFIISRLTSDDLRQAQENLIGQYMWAIKSPIAPSENFEVKTRKFSNKKRVAAPNLVFEED